MGKAKIGANAGKVWNLLNGDNRKWDYYELQKTTNLSVSELHQAIGWLARENKICFETMHDGKQYVYLEMNYYIG